MFERFKYFLLCMKLMWYEDNGWISKEEADRICIEHLERLF